MKLFETVYFEESFDLLSKVHMRLQQKLHKYIPNKLFCQIFHLKFLKNLCNIT